MPRPSRLTSARAFRRVLHEGTRAAAGSVTCIALPSGEQRPPRIGITAGRRVGGAVARNRAKRRLREAVRLEAGSLPAGTDLVLIASPAAVLRPFDALRGDLRRALERVGAAC